jgi:histidine ammonia-lyase
LLEDLLAIELLLASDVLAGASTRPALGTGTGAALDMVQEAIATADPYPDAVHRTLRARFPGPVFLGAGTEIRSAEDPGRPAPR